MLISFSIWKSDNMDVQGGDARSSFEIMGVGGESNKVINNEVVQLQLNSTSSSHR
jgi:hypothetical protein